MEENPAIHGAGETKRPIGGTGIASAADWTCPIPGRPGLSINVIALRSRCTVGMTPLRRLLARHLLGILLPLLAIMLGLVWWGSRSLLLSLAHRDGEARLRIAVQALDRRLTTVERAGGFISSYWEQGRLPFDDTEASAA